MQRKSDGKPARGCTAAEFGYVAKNILDEASRKFNAAGIKQRPVLSMDNDRIHTSARLADMGIPSRYRLKLPPYSPDLHRVIERVHGRICMEFRKQLHYDHSICTPKQYCKLLKEIFYSSQSQKVIAKDVDGLPDLWQHVARSGKYGPSPLS